ncbi:Uncharacterised protein [Bordetella pertussis]|nr:Uncharacterised protein [Bordetella pertussis]
MKPQARLRLSRCLGSQTPKAKPPALRISEKHGMSV